MADMKGTLFVDEAIAGTVTDVRFSHAEGHEPPEDTPLPDSWRLSGTMAMLHVSWEPTRANAFVAAARVPDTLNPQRFGLWSIERRQCQTDFDYLLVGAWSQTVLRRVTMATLHLRDGEIVMEDSRTELRKHLPIWLAARGRVLVTGLGLGCVVRGLLTNPEVTHIDVVELDPSILRIVGAEFKSNSRVTLHHGDALTIRWPRGTRWDFAWHDLWTEDDGLTRLHLRLMRRYMTWAGRQGAWGLPRVVRRLFKRDERYSWFLA